MRRRRGEVLGVGNQLHPLSGSAVQGFLDRDLDQGDVRGGSVPMLFAGRDPHHVPEAHLLDGAFPCLDETLAGEYDESLSQWMGVPCGPRPRREMDFRALRPSGWLGLEERIDPHVSCELL